MRRVELSQSRTKVTSVFWRKYTYLTQAVTTHNNFSPLSWSWSFLSNLAWHLHTLLLHTTSPFSAFTPFPCISLHIFVLPSSKSTFALTRAALPPLLFIFAVIFPLEYRKHNNWSVLLTPFPCFHPPSYYNSLVPPFFPQCPLTYIPLPHYFLPSLSSLHD